MSFRAKRSFVDTALLVCAALALVASPTEAQERTGGTIRVHIIGARSIDGNVGCALFSGGNGFPGEMRHAVQKVVGRFGHNHTATCLFENVPRGRYAVSLGHDENGNGELDKNVVGLPTEGWGVSNDAPARLAPPRYDEAAFDFGGNRKLIVVTLRYGI